MKKLIIVSSLALAAGVAIGYAFAPKAEVRAEQDEKSVEIKRPAPRRERPARRAAAAERVDTARIAQQPADGAAGAPAPGGQDRRGAWLDNLKKENPERYAQVTNRMARWRETRIATVQSRLDFLASIDTARMSKAEKKTHARLQELLVQREELMNSLDVEGSGAQLSGEERGDIMRQMRDVSHEINELNAAERENLIKRTAEELGFSGEDVGEIASTIKEIIEATDGGFGFRNPPVRPMQRRRGH